MAKLTVDIQTIGDETYFGFDAIATVRVPCTVAIRESNLEAAQKRFKSGGFSRFLNTGFAPNALKRANILRIDALEE